MSRKCTRKRYIRSKKRRDIPEKVSGVPGRSMKMKRFRSIKKQKRKFRRDKFQCTICLCKSHGIKEFLKCGHFFHKLCINKWLKFYSTCPICRMAITTNTGRHHQPNPEPQPTIRRSSLFNSPNDLNRPSTESIDASAILDNSREALFDSEEWHYSPPIFLDESPSEYPSRNADYVHISIIVLRMLLGDRLSTSNVLNSPAEANSELPENNELGFITGELGTNPSPTNEDEHTAAE